VRGGKRPTVAPRKFDTGAGKGTGDGPVLCVPRLETGAKPESEFIHQARFAPGLNFGEGQVHDNGIGWIL
jgi:hypothetical protein